MPSITTLWTGGASRYALRPHWPQGSHRKAAANCTLPGRRSRWKHRSVRRSWTTCGTLAGCSAGARANARTPCWTPCEVKPRRKMAGLCKALTARKNTRPPCVRRREV
nr:MAG TPA: hypothetical protein [Caudoviricetes sp.]